MEWVVRAGEAKPDTLVQGYGRHKGVTGLYGFSVQYAPGKSLVELARAGQFPNARISYAYDDELSAALAPLNLTMRLVKSPGIGYHHTFCVFYDANGVMLRQIDLTIANAIHSVLRQMPNPAKRPRP